MARRENFECSHYKEMIIVWDDKYAKYTDLVFIQCIHVWKYHTVFCKYTWLLCVNKNKILKSLIIPNLYKDTEPGKFSPTANGNML